MNVINKVLEVLNLEKFIPYLENTTIPSYIFNIHDNIDLFFIKFSIQNFF